MALRRIAFLAALLGAVGVLAGSLSAADRPVRVIQPPPSRPTLQLARPCLIDTTSCLDLSPAPFEPCLIATKRCSHEWTVVPLKSFKPDR